MDAGFVGVVGFAGFFWEICWGVETDEVGAVGDGLQYGVIGHAYPIIVKRPWGQGGVRVGARVIAMVWHARKGF